MSLYDLKQQFLAQGLDADSAEFNSIRLNAWILAGSTGLPPAIVLIDRDMTDRANLELVARLNQLETTILGAVITKGQNTVLSAQQSDALTNLQSGIDQNIAISTGYISQTQKDNLIKYELGKDYDYEQRSAAFLDFPLLIDNIRGVDTKGLGDKIRSDPYSAWKDLVTVDAVSGDINDWIKGVDTSGSKTSFYSNDLSKTLTNIGKTADNLGAAGSNLIGAGANISGGVLDLTKKLKDLTSLPISLPDLSTVLVIGAVIGAVILLK